MYIVQLLEDFEFLMPSAEGDVTTTCFLREAGVFDCFEAAHDTGVYYVGEGRFEVINISNFKVSY